jgi:hypothetical protein
MGYQRKNRGDVAMMKEIKNAQIKSTMLGTEDHGIFTFTLNLDYGGSAQGAGMYALDEPQKDKKGEFLGRFGTANGMQTIMDILDCLEVSSWEALIGEHIRVEADSGQVYKIGHLLKDQWYDFGRPE